MAVIEVIAKNQRRGCVTNKLATNDEGLCQSIRRWLYCIVNIDTPLMAITQQLLEARRVLRCGDQEYVLYPRQHERAEWVVDHGLVIHWQQLLGDSHSHRVEPRARTTGENDAASITHVATPVR
jgi:hypothetical protein